MGWDGRWWDGRWWDEEGWKVVVDLEDIRQLASTGSWSFDLFGSWVMILEGADLCVRVCEQENKTEREREREIPTQIQIDINSLDGID